MHKFLRTIGFSQYTRKKEIEQLISDFAKNRENIRTLRIDEDTTLSEIRVETSPGMGIAVVGELDTEDMFHVEYYFPYVESTIETSNADCSIQRHTEKETYAGLLDEYKVGISLIYYLENMMDYRQRELDHQQWKTNGVCLGGLAVKGKILLPVQKTKKQIAMAKVASKDRSTLLEAAKNGDEDAMETLTIEDIDLYSRISRRLMKEDVYSIIDTCFMPCGIECDQYAVIGDIQKIDKLVNQFTKEEIYDLMLECNDLMFHVVINQRDLLGEPKVGRRFKGQIWMQGTAKFES
ncbi:MAG: DUF3881 family protein [Hungatella sp.]